MWNALQNCFKIPELRKRILITIGIIALCRLAQNIPCPGLDPTNLNKLFEQLKSQGGAGDVVGLIDVFSGGALRRFAVAALGIMPYITMSIIIQVLSPVLPALEKLKREGESGHQKITQMTRIGTLVICVIQGGMLAMSMENPNALFGTSVEGIVINPGWGFRIMTVLILTAGTVILMWLGERISDAGVGNGASLIITIGIIEGLPTAFETIKQMYLGDSTFTILHLLLLVAFFLLVTAAVVNLTLGQRRVALQFARTTAGRRGNGPAQRENSFIPLRVNYANVMPIIFGQALLMFPPILIGAIAKKWSGISVIAPLFDYGSTPYMVIYGALLIGFTFFWVANQFNPLQIADDLKRQGAYIPGIRPGQATSDFLDNTMTRVTTIGAVYLTVVALLPIIVTQQFEMNQLVASYFGGASLLIIAGVLLDTIQQVESHLLTHRYDGFLSRGQLRSRRGGQNV